MTDDDMFIVRFVIKDISDQFAAKLVAKTKTTYLPLVIFLGFLHSRTLIVFADSAQTEYCSTFHFLSVSQCVTGVTSQLFSII